MGFSNNIKKLRVSNNLTQKDFCKQAGITQVTCSSYETGKTLPQGEDTLKKIAEIFGVTVPQLFSDDIEATLDERDMTSKSVDSSTDIQSIHGTITNFFGSADIPNAEKQLLSSMLISETLKYLISA